jgi:hypothetical protein
MSSFASPSAVRRAVSAPAPQRSASIHDFHFLAAQTRAPEDVDKEESRSSETFGGAAEAESDDEDLFRDEASSVTVFPEEAKKRTSVFGKIASLAENFRLSSTSSEASRQSTPTHPSPSRGLVWHAQILPDTGADVDVDPKYLQPDGALKKRSPKPLIRASDFFANVHQVGSDWIYTSPTGTGLNDWPGLDHLTVLSVTGVVVSKARIHKVKRYWTRSNMEGKSAHKPFYPANKGSIRVTLQAPPFTGNGWTEDSPGYMWWLSHKSLADAPALFHGTDAADYFNTSSHGNRAVATRCHHFAHRYARAKETAKDQLVYHCCILVEWDHGDYCTMFELAYINGAGGYAGKSNWQDDKDEHPPRLLTALIKHPSMIAPWNSAMAELRVQDLPNIKSLDDFNRYVKRYTGKGKGMRFYDPKVVNTAHVRVAKRTKGDLAAYINNYIRHTKKYSEEARNCQTFAADLFRMLSGNTEKPYHPINQVLYSDHTHAFFYDPPPGK